MLPFTRSQFFDLFGDYNSAIWPAIPVSYLLAIGAIALAWRFHPRADSLVSAVLSLLWAWVGLAYHGLFFTRINPASWLFAGLFLVQAAIFAFHAVRRAGLNFGPRSTIRTTIGWPWSLMP